VAQFDVGMVHRLADQMEGIALDIKKHVNSPDELSQDIKRMTSVLESFQTLAQKASNSGSNPVVNQNDVV